MFSANTTQVSTGGYQISRSLRFNSADSAYLSRTYSNSATDLKKQTFSFWYKRTEFATDGLMFGGYDGTSGGSNYIGFLSSSGTTVLRLFFAEGDIFTTQVFRDPSAWYHIVVALDTTQATDTNRLKLYVNGSQVTSFTVNAWPTLNSSSQFALTNNRNAVGSAYSGNGPMNGYMTEVNFIDGQALTPSSFGETNAQTGVWQPKAYSGSYGTNGFYLNFSDNSNTTAATLGKDYSGNGNNWTPNNFSVTAGSGNDSLVDSPTSYGTDTGVGGSVRGNYCTWNPISTTSTITNGNLDFSVGATTPVKSSLYVPSGKWYFEITPTAITGTSIGEISINDSNGNIAVGYRSTGTKDVDSYSTNAAYGATWAVGDIIGVAFDVDNKQVTFYKNGTSQGAITYTGSALTTNTMGVQCDWRTSATFAGTANFGQRPFAYTAPSGYKALCTQNLPTPTIGATTATQANKYFDVSLYTGTSANQSITNSGSFQPDLVWIKVRSQAYSNRLFDVTRGVNNVIYSNLTNAEATEANSLTSFNSNGFSLGVDGTNGVNANTYTYVGWQWKANGSGSTNTSGSITSTVSANTTSGFSVVTYTGTGANATVGHGLGVAPSMLIIKRRNDVVDWAVYHTSLGATKYMNLNLTDAAYTASTPWNNTAPTSSVFSIGTAQSTNFSNTATYVAYCFAEVAGYSKFGSYTGNGSADGPFVYTGFRPAFVMTKRTDASSEWTITDLRRPGYNLVNKSLYANQSSAELTYNILDQLSNGFKLRDSDGIWNGSGGTYIYMAFAENPFKYSLAR